MDGGMSNNQPVLDESTIRVNPFASDSDICPVDSEEPAKRFRKSNVDLDLTPENAERVWRAVWPIDEDKEKDEEEKLYQQGYSLTEKYILSDRFQSKLLM